MNLATPATLGVIAVFAACFILWAVSMHNINARYLRERKKADKRDYGEQP